MKAVFDLDDTISRHRNRDFANAEPISETIEKLRKLKADGWEICIYSARGQNSCKGDLQLIEERNRAQVEEWLKNYDVPYDELRFGKPLGDVYIDDKGTGLDDFLHEDYRKLHGNSGAEIYRAGKRVLKQCKTARSEADWYIAARGVGLNVPDVNSVVLDRIDVEYIDGIPGNRKQLSGNDLKRIIAEIALMAVHKTQSRFDIDGYLRFVKERLAIPGWTEEFSKLLSYITKNGEEIRKRSSFSHGDLSLSNVIFTPGKLYLIDPSPRVEFSTFLNDFAKLRFSLDGGEQLLHGGERPEEYDARLRELSWILDINGWLGIVTAMEAVHWIRMLKYFDGKEDLIRRKAKELEGSL